MSEHRLVCASCAGPVSEGRCAVCRQYRAVLHERRQQNWLAITLIALIALIAAIIAGLLFTAAQVTA